MEDIDSLPFIVNLEAASQTIPLLADALPCGSSVSRARGLLEQARSKRLLPQWTEKQADLLPLCHSTPRVVRFLV